MLEEEPLSEGGVHVHVKEAAHEYRKHDGGIGSGQSLGLSP